ncbi:MAG: molybdate transport system permease protein [Deferribacteres bacterium]|jgi:molybdate transport system permease protein|nr:molybdate transport system permease protein [Deferribacteres bacterium]
MIKYSDIFKFITYLLVIFFVILISFSFDNLSTGSFKTLLNDNLFLKALKFGILSATFATFLSCIFGIPAGFFIARSKGRVIQLIDSFFDIPVVVPPLIIGVFILNFLSDETVVKVTNMVFTFKGAVLAQFFISFPFTLKMSKNAFELVSPIYERIAMTLGAGYFKSFYDTTFKLALNGILSGVILSWLRSFGEFGATLLVAGGIRGKTENLPIYIYLNMMEGDYDKGIAAAFLGVLFVFVFIVTVRFIGNKKRGDV